MALACQLSNVSNLVRPNYGLGIASLANKTEAMYVPSKSRTIWVLNPPPELGIGAGQVERTDGQAFCPAIVRL